MIKYNVGQNKDRVNILHQFTLRQDNNRENTCTSLPKVTKTIEKTSCTNLLWVTTTFLLGHDNNRETILHQFTLGQNRVNILHQFTLGHAAKGEHLAPSYLGWRQR